ncbi:MAG: SCO6745 family protein [Acidimicrobiales bacterium]
MTQRPGSAGSGMTPEELVVYACPKIGALGAAFYFTPETVARGTELGLDGFRFYFLGRGGVLGDVEPAVVQSAFGYFESGLVAKMWSTARERASVSVRDAGRAYVAASQDFGRRYFAELGGLESFCDAAEAVISSADPAGLALYAALSAEPLADDIPARAMQLVTVLRELRGSIHLLAIVAAGISPMVAHYYRRPDHFTTFGYAEADVPTITDEVGVTMVSVDAHTDRLMSRAFGALDGTKRASLADGVTQMADAAP